jgi:hypothetical protein
MMEWHGACAVLCGVVLQASLRATRYSCQNRGFTILFYDFTIQFEGKNSLFLLSGILEVIILRFTIYPNIELLIRFRITILATLRVLQSHTYAVWVTWDWLRVKGSWERNNMTCGSHHSNPRRDCYTLGVPDSSVV